MARRFDGRKLGGGVLEAVTDRRETGVNLVLLVRAVEAAGHDCAARTRTGDTTIFSRYVLASIRR